MVVVECFVGRIQSWRWYVMDRGKREWRLMTGPKDAVDKWAGFLYMRFDKRSAYDVTPQVLFPTTIPCFVHCNMYAFNFSLFISASSFCSDTRDLSGRWALWFVHTSHHLVKSHSFAQGKAPFPLQDGKILALCALFHFPSSSTNPVYEPIIHFNGETKSINDHILSYIMLCGDYPSCCMQTLTLRAYIGITLLCLFHSV